MKLSELLMTLLYCDDYKPGDHNDGRNYMCVVTHRWAIRVGTDEAWTLYRELKSVIEGRIYPYGTLENYLAHEKGIERYEYEPRYEWFFKLALELENRGK